MRFSFVIPTYNNKTLLRNTLEALNYQEGFGEDDYEVVVVDDGSTDGTELFIKKVNHNYSLQYFYLSRTEDSCRSKTRNHGWKNAKGEIIIFIDSDIIVKRDYLTQLNRYFSHSKDILVLGNRLMLNRDIAFQDIKSCAIYQMFYFNNNHYSLLEYRYFLFEVSSYNANAIMCPWMQVYSCNMAVAKEQLEHVGGFDENFKEWGMEDLELGYSLYKRGVQITIHPKLDVLHQYHGERNDLIIENKKIPGYEKNIDYFLGKHPGALKMSKKIAYKFLKGEVASNKILMEVPLEKVEIHFREIESLDRIKREILAVIEIDNIKPIVYDYVEKTDLDIWIQLLGNKKNVIRYHPMSRRINVRQMMGFIETEKSAQRQRA